MVDDHHVIARSHIFVLIDGTFVVKMADDHVRNLLNGQDINFQRRDFGAAITDFELNQLIDAGIVATFNRETVTLATLPQPGHSVPQADEPLRAFYLHTKLTLEHRPNVALWLQRSGMDEQFEVQETGTFIALWGREKRTFASFDQAEQARQLLVERMPDIFSETVVAFVDEARV